ncbi:NADH:flavin oxidoreductase [Pectinatus haikarae]|uniref:2,4-dienoyl-CoA reductase-like NADH-dependent reductase (Old Yellow Enzyme family) n=1 Tax=Pectinatus haikarae TaxID=349096 RepID=A0ABT9YAY0_9FIRM|nr:NADH:flavin oxidoreductase [Pectinatus haikarae]MDQ0204995.1 2,4-dienoyl-CoA reductase-like NADH-dependent reductase (Old Yellow Enzyme family) [Pectinatus haikarae]
MIPLDKPAKLSHLTLKNPFIRSAVHSFLGSEDGFMTDLEFQMYEKLSSNNIALIISGHCCVLAGGLANKEQIRIDDDKYIAQFSKAAALIHHNNCLFMPQINHAGPRAIDTEEFFDVSAGDLPKNHHAEELSLKQISHIKTAFINAASRLKRAGVDGVQLHGAHSYLLSRFIDKTFNKRRDEYGGNIENRFRLCAQIIAGIKEKCGPDFPVSIKINNDTDTDNNDYAADMNYVMNKCRELDVEFVEWSGVDFINQPRADSLYYFDRIAEFARSAPLPISIVGGIKSVDDIAKVLDSKIPLISLARPLICEPDILTRFAAGTAEKSSCLACNRCFAVPHLHHGVRCILHWRDIRKQQES